MLHTGIRPDDLHDLDDADAAALRARQAWLRTARSPQRKGKQLPPEDDEWLYLLFMAGRGFGKLLSLETRIPTPDGWTTMGDVKVGDVVFDESGRPCRVTWTSAPKTPLKAYRLTFSDGSTMDACADHQWVTWNAAERKAFSRSPYEDTTRFPVEWPAWSLRRRCASARGRVGPQIRTTAQIVQTLTYGKRGDLNHCIPQCDPLRLPTRKLPIPPYILGLWLGNGYSRMAYISAHQDDIPNLCENIRALGFETAPTSNHQRFRILGLTKLLRLHGQILNKHIPPAYLRASHVQRLALLQGLMDSDGGRDTANLVSFTNCVKHIADDFAELAVGLGLKVRRDDRIPWCTNYDVDGQRSYRVAFTPHFQPFQLRRKGDQVDFSCSQALRRRHRMIVSAEPIHGIAMRCIAVDSPHKMYLAGDAMIPTHNTLAETQWMWWQCWQYPETIGHFIGPTLGDTKGTGFEGPAGFRAVVPAECLWRGSWERAYRSTNPLILRLANGSVIRGFGAQDEGGRLRGPQCHALAGDELREWEKPAGNLEAAMNNALFGLRLPYPDGSPSRAVFGTTPRPIPFLKRFEKRPGMRVIRGTSRENLINLSQSYRAQLLALDGTLMGRQEIDGAYIDEESDLTVIKRHWLKLWPADKPLPEFSFVLEVYDTAASEENFDIKKQTTDPTGSIVLGLFNVAQVFTEQERRRLGVRSKYAALLCDAWNERLGLPELLEKARSQHLLKWGKPGRRGDVVLIENKSSGPGLRQFMAKWGVPTWPYNPKRDKLMRLHAISPLLNQGMLFIPESAREDRRGMPRDWCEPFLEQVCGFAGEGSVEHDEMVDCISSAFTYFRDRGMLEAKPEEEFKDAEEKRTVEEREAEKVWEAEKIRKQGNPYG